MARARQYEAFISYSHAADSALATELQRALNRIARPSYKWWQWWPPRVFRDQTNLAAATDLGARIEDALLGSDAFVLLASPLAAASPWVDREVATWCARKPLDRIFIALTEGSLEWDDDKGDFDHTRSTALPPSLRGAFDTEPLWVDFSAVREDRPFARDPLFLDGAATLAAAIRGTDKDSLVGEDVRQRRRARQLAGGAITSLTLLAVLATIAAVYAFVQRNNANERARLALSRQLAAQAVSALDVDPERSLALAARAATTEETDEAESALRDALRTSRVRAVINVGADVNEVALDPSGNVVAAGVVGGAVRTWDLRTGDPLATHELAGDVLGVSFDADGDRVLGVGPAGAAVWAAARSGAPPLARFDQRFRPAAVAWHGPIAATADVDGFVRLWRPDNGRLVRRLRPPGPLAAVNDVAFSRDGSQLAAAVGPRAVVWNLRAGSKPLVRSYASDLVAIAFSPDGRTVANGDDLGGARVWNLRTGVEKELNGHEQAIDSVAFSPDGRSLVTASQDETARIWDLRSRRTRAELRGHNDLVRSAAFTRDGKRVVTGGEDGTIRVWAVETDPVLAELVVPSRRPLFGVAFHPRGRLLVTASEDETAQVWDWRSGRIEHVLRHDDSVEAASFSPDGEHVLTAGTDGTARVWKTGTERRVATLGRAGGPALLDAAMSPDGGVVATAGFDPRVLFWRWADERMVDSRSGFEERVDGVDFSPVDGLVAAASGPTVHVWRTEDDTPAAVFRDRDGERLWDVALDPGGELVAAGSASGAAWVWDVAAKDLVVGVEEHTDTVSAVAFSGDGRYLLTAGYDGVARVWSLPNGGLVTTVSPRGTRLEAAAFARRGRTFAVAGDGGIATVFDCRLCRPLDELVCLAGSRVTQRVRAEAGDAFRRCD